MLHHVRYDAMHQQNYYYYNLRPAVVRNKANDDAVNSITVKLSNGWKSILQLTPPFRSSQ
jgi:hypothetical protein